MRNASQITYNATHTVAGAFIWCVTILVIFFAGEPDLLTAIIEFLLRR